MKDDNNETFDRTFKNFIEPLLNGDSKFLKDLDLEFLAALNSEDFDPVFWENKFLNKIRMTQMLKLIIGGRG